MLKLNGCQRAFITPLQITYRTVVYVLGNRIKAIRTDKSKEVLLDVMWLYRPEDMVGGAYISPIHFLPSCPSSTKHRYYSWWCEPLIFIIFNTQADSLTTAMLSLPTAIIPTQST